MAAIRGPKRRQVRRRARGICEYCRLSETLVAAGAIYEVEHIRPASLFSRSDPAADDLDNLAWACPRCNLRKGNKIDGFDAQTDRRVRLFNPRSDRWSDHFVALPSGHIVSVESDAIGRVTVRELKFNQDPDAVRNRAEFHSRDRQWPAM